MPIVLIILAVIIIYYFYNRSKNPTASLLGGSTTPISEVISHWAQNFPFYTMSSNEFYLKIEALIKSHEMPDTKILRVQQKEAGLLSSSREYLRIRRGNLIFEVCAAPFGKDFFVSWWLYETEGGMTNLLKGTKFGDFLKNRASKRTFYQADTESMFRSCAHECILEAVDAMTESTGTRLTELQRQPVKGGI
jgi:hypothetical protein